MGRGRTVGAVASSTPSAAAEEAPAARRRGRRPSSLFVEEKATGAAEGEDENDGTPPRSSSGLMEASDSTSPRRVRSDSRGGTGRETNTTQLRCNNCRSHCNHADKRSRAFRAAQQQIGSVPFGCPERCFCRGLLCVLLYASLQGDTSFQPTTHVERTFVFSTENPQRWPLLPCRCCGCLDKPSPCHRCVEQQSRDFLFSPPNCFIASPLAGFFCADMRCCYA